MGTEESGQGAPQATDERGRGASADNACASGLAKIHAVGQVIGPDGKVKQDFDITFDVTGA